jgi:hypothetical protein
VEELELVWVCCGWRTPPKAHSNHYWLRKIPKERRSHLHGEGSPKLCIS